MEKLIAHQEQILQNRGSIPVKTIFKFTPSFSSFPIFLKTPWRWIGATTMLLGFVIGGIVGNAYAMVEVGKYRTHELVFTADGSPGNPFDTYLLKLEIIDPAGKKFLIDGFYDGDGAGGQNGKVWKARITPYSTGIWSWRTVEGDALDSGLSGLNGQFLCVESGDKGGVIGDGKHFKFQDGDFVYLQGDFLDGEGGLTQSNGSVYSTHVFMSEKVADTIRDVIISRQRDVHAANKINVYFANKGDYKGAVPVTPWVGTKTNNDKQTMDLARWKLYDSYIQRFQDNKMFAEMWFFADDSGFGGLSPSNKNRLIRYAMARTSAFTHTMYVLALEWTEGWSHAAVTEAGNFFQAHNPWKRMVSVHNHADWAFSAETWPSFIATQVGNTALPQTVNEFAITMRNNENLPHLSEEYGWHYENARSNPLATLREKSWANFLGGAAGGGTGYNHKALLGFISQSRVPFQRMAAANNLASSSGGTSYVLAEIGHHYVVYNQSGTFSLNVTGSGLVGRWFNPRDSNATLGNPFNVSPGTQTFTPPNSPAKDWILWVSDGSNLNSGELYPSVGHVMTQEIIGSGSGNDMTPPSTPTGLNFQP